MEIHFFQAQVYTFEYEPAKLEDLRVVVGVDFGTTFSGFSYAYIQDNKAKTEIVVNEEWGNFKSTNKTNTVLQYDENNGVVTWGADVLSSEPSRRKKFNNKLPRPVEYFKFYLGDVPESKKPKLPSGITFEKAITDYLRQMGIDFTMIEKIENHWPGINFYNNVRLVFTVPAEFNENSKTIMRRCIYNAGLIQSIGTLNLQFTTEPEAAAIHCMNRLKELKLTTGAKYLVVDCGGGTVDLIVRELLADNRLAETTVRTGDFCGGTYVDDEFLKFLERRKKCPAIKQYVTGSEREQLSEVDEWVIDLDFDTVKSFFDPLEVSVNQKYLQYRIKEKFGKVLEVAIPPSPAAAIVKGACEYGLDMKTVTTRVLKWTYGVEVSKIWETGDPPSRKTHDGRIHKFLLLARKGTEVDVDEEFSESMIPIYPNQTSILFKFFYTTKYNATFCDEPEMKSLGNFEVDLPDTHLGLNRFVLISLCFASMESTVATAKNEINGKVYRTTFSTKC
ncbi:3376_t:CDS:10 [Funneliformis caledonium]|uniref:3376_t:CDS:1 n=1 Tax=Funneliformis caledonium TaxID=1117310 RepID=A0A9N9HJ65_9GLOM|nr:3376_t:CDS:10 [Funneliformis caledonium]